MGNVFHHFIERVVAVAETVEVIADPSARVGEQVADGDFLRHAFILEFEILEILSHGRVEINFSLLGEHHQQRGGECFADGAGLHQGIGIDGQRVFNVRDAESRRPLFAFVINTNGDTGDMESLHFLLDARRDDVEI
ncbi:MAG: hypothetical protein U0X93_11515 [Anaerolineales bacterium]